ncbi:MAG: hypothetical protein MJZ56_02080 [Bacteroidales bacterium]|nr:hypothetical protein [Bacteroidales bacterium]
MLISSKTVVNNRKADDLFAFLSDMNNVAPLLPAQVRVDSVDYDNISFTIIGMGSLSLRVSQRVPSSLIRMIPVGKTPFPFVLDVVVNAAEEKSECRFQIDAELNFMMKMMAERPLKNLVEMMADKAETL